MPHIRLLLCSALLATLTGCAVGPHYHAPDTTSVSTSFDAAPATASTSATTQPASIPPPATQPLVDLTHWWTSLNDPTLTSLVTRAVDSNFDVNMAFDRLQQSRYQEYRLTGGVLPGVGDFSALNGSAAVARGSGSNSVRGRIDPILHSADNTAGLAEVTHVAGFDASWELDLFGHYRHQIEAAQADTQSAAEMRHDVLISVVADVARTYIDLRTLQLRLEIARENIAIQQRTVHLVQERFNRGLTNDLDVVLAQRQFATINSEIAPLQAAVAQTERRLAVLIGLHPDALREELDRPAALPASPPQVAAGMPIDLLRRRPDLRRAERDLAAATARTGIATSNLFPRISLSGAVGIQGQGIGRTPVVSSDIWSLGPALYWPLLDFGELDAAVKQQDYRTRELLLAYQRNVVQAVEEVDDALTNYSAEQQHLAELGIAVDASRHAATLAAARYRNGLTDFLNVLDAQRQLYELQDQYAVAQQSVIRQFIALYKALGGGWEGYETPAPPAPKMALAAARHELFSSKK